MKREKNHSKASDVMNILKLLKKYAVSTFTELKFQLYAKIQIWDSFIKLKLESLFKSQLEFAT